MNMKMIKYIIGKLMVVESLLMLLPYLCGLIYHESTAVYFIYVAIPLFVFGTYLSYKQPLKTKMFAKEGFIAVALCWILLSFFGALPFYLSNEIPNFVNAFFEIVSGFTTTGSSILTDVEAMSNCMLFWRSFSHWVGGMGILVFVLAILPQSEASSLQLMKAEVPGPVVGKLVSKVKMTARLLYYMYAFLTAIELILLMAGNVPFFDSLLISFGTAGTGGFAIKNTSIAFYDSAYVDAVTTVFMILFGINFNLIYLAFLGKIKDALKSEELHWYMTMIFGAAILITFNIAHLYDGSIITAFRYAIFQVGSIITTTGFATADFALWPMFSQMILLLLLFTGAMAGSTGGGLKISRIIIYCKNAKRQIIKAVHPRMVTSLKLDGKTADKEVVENVHSYLFIYILVLIVGIFLLSFDNLDFYSIFTSVATCLNNVGPGFGELVGPTSNFDALSDFSTLVLSFIMLIGRLEIFPMLMLFSPRSWKK